MSVRATAAPMASFRGCVTSSDLQVAAERERRARQTDHDATRQKDERDLRRTAPGERKGQERHRLDDLGHHERLNETERQERECRADEALQHAFHHERRADEPVGGTDEAHDADLLATRVDCKADRAVSYTHLTLP